MGAKEAFDTKLEYLIQMVKIYGGFSIPLDWFEYAQPSKESKSNKNGIHEYGTTFTILRLEKEYSKQLKQRLDAEGIKLEYMGNGYYFSRF